VLKKLPIKDVLCGFVSPSISGEPPGGPRTLKWQQKRILVLQFSGCIDNNPKPNLAKPQISDTLTCTTSLSQFTPFHKSQSNGFALISNVLYEQLAHVSPSDPCVSPFRKHSLILLSRKGIEFKPFHRAASYTSLKGAIA
jgi:hypothetical protein